MLTLLLHEADYHRCATRLRNLGNCSIVLIDDEGTHARVDGSALPADLPNLAWLSATVFLSRSFQRYCAMLRDAPALRWVHTDAAGVDTPVLRDLLTRRVRISNNHSQAIGVAEYVLGSVLDHFQGGAVRRAHQSTRAWQRNVAREVNGSQWLIVGFGAIGQEVAKRARAFGARIVGMRRTPGPHPLADEMLPLIALPTAMAQADVVVLAIPLTADTHHLIDRQLLRLMKPDAVLVNVGRGELLEEQVLPESLDAGRPAHAILDVFEREPYPADGPLWSHPAVTMTSHTSALSSGLQARSEACFLDNLQRFLAGTPLINEVPP